MEQFLNRHKDSIIGVLSGFDRVLFRGTVRSISHLDGMKRFLSYHHVLLKDFGAFVLEKSSQIKQVAKAFTSAHGRPFQYIAVSILCDPKRPRVQKAQTDSGYSEMPAFLFLFY